jgi:anti-sigma regulatory factor (Ser/Thr protein kinase)
LSSDASAATRLRERLQFWLLSRGINSAVGSDLISAVSEVFANAVHHPLDRVSDEIVVDGEAGTSEIVVRVRDDGSWNDSLDRERPHLGLKMVDRLVDAVEVDRRPGETVVTLRRSL